MNAVLTLPGIAGLLLTIGMSVDANVIIFERIKEELNSKTPNYAALKMVIIKPLLHFGCKYYNFINSIYFIIFRIWAY